MACCFQFAVVLLSFFAVVQSFTVRSRCRLSISRGQAPSLRTPTTMLAGKSLSVGIVGATGAVGEEILSVMEKRNFPCSSLKLFASEKSSGKEVHSKVYGSIPLEPFSFEAAKNLDVVLVRTLFSTAHGSLLL